VHSLSSELLLKGYLFHKGGLKITVSKAYMPNNNDFQAITNSHFIEISLIVPMGQVLIFVIILILIIINILFKGHIC
jgi:hypothetical protein